MKNETSTIIAILALLISIVAVGIIYIAPTSEIGEDDLSRVESLVANNQLQIGDLAVRIAKLNTELGVMENNVCECQIDEEDLENLDEDIEDNEDDIDDMSDVLDCVQNCNNFTCINTC